MTKHVPFTPNLLTLLLALFIGSGTAFAYDFYAVCPTGQTIFCKYYGVGTVCVVPPEEWSNGGSWGDYSKPRGIMEIPTTVAHGGGTYTVAAISNYAFRDCTGLTSVTIPNSVTQIYGYAFWGCTGLTSLTLPNSVTTIYNYAFRDCTGLTSVTLNSNAIVSATYTSSSNLGTMFGSQVTNYILGLDVTSIGDYAFYECSSLTSVEIPNSVTSIGNSAFQNCSGLTGPLTIPNSLTSIGNSAFQNCSGLTGPLSIPNSVTSIGNSVFKNCSGLTSFTIPNSVTSIGDNAFSGCSGLTSITIPNSVTSIGASAFYGCSGLTGPLTIPNSVTLIGNSVFENCSGLTSLTIPNSVTSIGNNAFSGCSGLTSVTIPNSVTSIGASAFYGCSGLTSVTIGESVTSVGSYAFSGCTGLTLVTIGNSVTSIGSSAFSGCTGLTSVTIPNSVIQIGEYAFYNCSGFMGNLTIPNSVTSIGQKTFYNCSGLTSLTIGNSVTSIGGSAFSGCSGLTSLTIGNSVTSIGGSAFSGCSGLTSVTIPNSVTSIGMSAFYSCINLNSVTIGEGVTTIGYYAFWDCPNLAIVQFNAVNCTQMHTRTGTSYSNYQYWSVFNSGTTTGGATPIVALSIGNNVTNIPEYAFRNSPNLMGPIVIPDSVTSIGEYAFYQCTNPNSLTIGEGVTTIGGYAFWGCPNLRTVHFNAISCSSMLTNTQAFQYSVFNSGINNGGSSPIVSLTIGPHVTCIPNYAFYQSNGLNSFISYAFDPPIVGSYAIPNKGSLTISVPCGAAASYQVADGWNWWNASNFVEFEDGYYCPIVFEDENVKAVCIQFWDANGDGELSYVEASAVTSLNSNFIFNEDIVSFNELQYFTSLTTVVEDEFMLCSNLSAISLPPSLAYIGNSAFEGCSSLMSITSQATMPPAMGTNAFNGVPSNATVIVPCGHASLYQTTLGWNNFSHYEEYDAGDDCIIAFVDNNVKALCVANWDTDGNGELSYTEAAAVTDLVDVFKNNNSITSFEELQYFSGLNAIRNQAFFGCSNLASIIIPSSVSNIGSSAFSGCSGLTSVEIPNHLTSINNSVFQGCSGLTSVTIPNSVTSIGDSAFSGCSGLTSVAIPNCVTTIGTGAFSNCSGLASLEIPNLLASINNSLFFGCSGLVSVEIPSSVTVIGDAAFQNCSGLTSVVIPGSVTSIGNQAFYDCSSLASITSLADTPASLGSSVFVGVPQTATVIVPCGTTEAYQTSNGWNTFINYSEIITEECAIVFADDNVKQLCVSNWDNNSDGELSYSEAAAVTELGDVFKNNTTITSFDELQYFTSLTAIPNTAFQGCTGLASITLPSGIESIGNGSFYNCTGLTTLTVLALIPPALGSQTFRNVETTIPVYIPCCSYDTYQSQNWGGFTNFVCYDNSCNIVASASPTSGGTVSGGGIYFVDDTCTLVASAAEGYTFVYWTEDGEAVSTSASFEFVVTGSRSLTANFIPFTESQLFAEYYPDANDPSASYVKLYGFNPQNMSSNFSHFIVYRTECSNEWPYTYANTTVVTDDLYDSVYVDLEWPNMQPGIYKWGVEAVYNGNRGEEIEGHVSWAYPIEVNEPSLYTAEDYVMMNGLAPQAEQVNVESLQKTPGLTRGSTAYACNTSGGSNPTGWICYDIDSPSAGISLNSGITVFGGDLAEDGFVYATYNNNKWYKIDPLSGTVISNGTLGMFFVDCAYDYTSHIMYGSYSGNLYTWDLATNITTLVGSMGVTSMQMIACDLDGQLYGLAHNTGNFYAIDKATGACTLINGSTGYSPNYVQSGGFDHNTGKLYWAGYTNTGVFCEIDKTTGVITELANNVGEQLCWCVPYIRTGEIAWSNCLDKVIYCSITASANPAEGGTVTGAGAYTFGASCTLMATPAANYTFANWTKNGTAVSTEATYTFTVTESADYVANFTLNTYAVTATPVPTAGGTITGAGSYGHGTSCTLTATANAHYDFVNWTKDGNVVSTEPSVTFTVTEAGTYVAHFGLKSYAVTAEAVPEEGGTIAGTGTYTYGETCTLTATPADGYSFDHWSEGYEFQYFTIESLEDDNTITLTIPAVINAGYMTSVSYSIDNGTTWNTTEIDDTNQTISVTLSNSGDKVLFKGIGRTMTYGNSHDENQSYFSATKYYVVYGNIASLLYGDDFVDKKAFPTNSARTYQGLFYHSTTLTSAQHLVLPFNHVAGHCFRDMFYGCTALSQAPELPAAALNNDCYMNMFSYCTALTQAPELPATTLAPECYNQMFIGCSSLTQVPELPNTSLAHMCYYRMFEGCTALTHAPVLPTATLASKCYYRMFYGCTSLNEITCLATDISATDCTSNWMNNVSATGTFHKASGMNDWTTGTSGIPSGWIVEDHIEDYAAEYFTIESLEDGNTITLTIGSAVTSANLSYVAWSKDQVNWTTTTIDNTEQVISVPANAHEKVYWKGEGTRYAYSYQDATQWSVFSANGQHKVLGNIASLLYGDDFAGVTALPIASRSYQRLFSDDTHLTDASNLILPFTDIQAECYGNMFQGCTSLISVPELPATTLKSYCYQAMFSGCSSLTESPALPATTLASYCYNGMFRNCTSLTQAPVLPATTLANYCYTNMFNGCTSLMAAPALPATTLAKYCYNQMFLGCSSIQFAPALPATLLAERCYASMFYGCISLTTAPSLAATTLTDYCYAMMFKNCSSLTKAPVLPATLLAESCYYQMFNGCTSLNDVTCLATDISSTDCVNAWLGNVASTGTFYKDPLMTGWTINSQSGIPSGWMVEDYIEDYAAEYFTIESLEDGNTITLTIGSAVTSAQLNYVAWSKDKVNWTTTTVDDTEQVISVPASAHEKVYWKGEGTNYASGYNNTTQWSIFSATGQHKIYGNIASLLFGDNFEEVTALPLSPNNGRNFQRMFSGNTKLVDASNLLIPFATIQTNCYASMFNGCTSLTQAPRVLPAMIAKSYCYTSMFENCTSLVKTPELPATSLANCCYQQMFRGCTSLTSAPDLPALTMASACYNSMFRNCYALTTVPELPATTLATQCYANMFISCGSLTSAPALPATTLATECYTAMFSGCNGIMMAPELPATVLAQACYQNMFYNCSSLNEITCLANDISATNCTTNWLYNVASAGTFHKNEDMNAWPTGVSGIPEGWTVEDEPIATPTISYNEPSITFTVTEPMHFFAYFTPNLFTQESALAQGWNWWAPMVQASVADIEAALGDTLVQVKPQDDPLGENLAMGEMYRIQTSAPCNLTLTGIRLSSATVSITNGYNWFGYTGNEPVAIATVFGSTFGPSTGDKIISQDDGFAIYGSNGWSGTLTTLQPGHGYVYISNSSGTKTVVFE